MSTPPLTEVFVVREASVQSLSQRYKVPIEFAEWANEDSSRHADVLVALFVWAGGPVDLRDRPLGELKREYDGFMTRVGLDIVGLLDRYPAKKKELMSLTATPVRSNMRMNSTAKIKQTVKDIAPKSDKRDEAVLTMSDGSHWVELNDIECDKEGDEMQHCGRNTHPGSKMYSFRDVQNKSHVTAEVNDAGGEDVPRLMQCKGKQNKAPDRKHWPAVEAFCRKIGCVPNESGGFDATEDVLFDWLSDQMEGG